MADVSLCQLTKQFRNGRHRVTAVSNLSLSLASGEIVSIIGPSGCGKTTLLRLIAGLETPTQGTVSIGGRDVTDRPASARRCAMMFQNDALYPHLNVFDNIAFGLKARGVEKVKRDQRVREVSALLDLTDLQDRRPCALSGGQRKRAALGRAIAPGPEVVLLDEPLSYIDAGQRVVLRTTLKAALRSSGSTALHVTHDCEEAMSVADRLAVMLDGKLAQVGEPGWVYDNPVNWTVACLITRPSVNLWPGDILRSADAMIFRTVDGDFPLPLEAKHLRTDRKWLMAVRADALHPCAEGDSSPSLSVRVDAVERLGAVWDVYGVTAGGRKVVARVLSPARIYPSRFTPWFVDHDRTLYFESGDSGANMMYERNKADN